MDIISFESWLRMARALVVLLVCGTSPVLGADNQWKWGPVKKDDCKPGGLRQVSSLLQNVPPSISSDFACQRAPRNVMGIDFPRPDRCVDRGNFGEWGEWDVPDTSCVSAPPPAPTRGERGTLSSTAPLEGYADIHVHQMGDLGFGGSIIWGRAFGPEETVLGQIPLSMKEGHDRTEALFHCGTEGLFHCDILVVLLGTATHGEQGDPTFTSWPSRDLVTHQQAYEDWLFRAYQGGMRLMVMLAENSEDMFGRGENNIPLLGKHTFQDVKQQGRTGNDMEALEWQVRAAYNMQKYVDDQNGGAGLGWYRIVRDPDEALSVITQGKLAVILGTELQHLFNCDADRPHCNKDMIIEGLNRLEAMGVNYVFPIHHKLNQFGGPAQFTLLNNGPTENCIETKQPCSSVGLTDLGRFLVEEMTARGMLIDTEHMSWKAFNDAMDIAEARRYPVLASHVVPFPLQADTGQTERARTADQLRRLLNAGGIVGIILGVNAEEYSPSKTMQPRVPISCGGADQWANAYLFIRDLAGGAIVGRSGRIALGSDWNGFASWPGPRYDTSPCAPRTWGNQPIPKAPRVSYPILLPPELMPAAIHGTPSLDRYEWYRPWDYNKVGLMHAGLIPDFIEDLRLVGLTLADLEPLYRSARGVVELWRTARDLDVPGGQHHLRWVPRSPFDVLTFEHWDVSRNVGAQDDVGALADFPLCRSRNGHKLGFEQNDACQLVEAPEPLPTSLGVELVASHSGKCIVAADDVVQRTCRTGTFEQRWEMRAVSDGRYAVVSIHSEKCLDVGDGSISGEVAVIESPCHGNISQRWELRDITGGTTEFVNQKTGKCLQVPNGSMVDGVALVQSTCLGSIDQQFIRRTPTPLRAYELPAVPISAYHAGRCLDVEDASTGEGAHIQQWECDGSTSQRWQLRSEDRQYWEIVNVNSSKCLAVSGELASSGASVRQRSCNGREDQKWEAVPSGNTFDLKVQHSRHCLHVSDESRENGSQVLQFACTGASNQKWSVDSLRASDYDRLYQADKRRIEWLGTESAAYPIAVTVDGARPICRSRDAMRWVGVVSGSQCVGKTYDGAPVTTASFDQLFQAQ